MLSKKWTPVATSPRSKTTLIPIGQIFHIHIIFSSHMQTHKNQSNRHNRSLASDPNGNVNCPGFGANSQHRPHKCNITFDVCERIVGKNTCWLRVDTLAGKNNNRMGTLHVYFHGLGHDVYFYTDVGYTIGSHDRIRLFLWHIVISFGKQEQNDSQTRWNWNRNVFVSRYIGGFHVAFRGNSEQISFRIEKWR